MEDTEVQQVIATAATSPNQNSQFLTPQQQKETNRFKKVVTTVAKYTRKRIEKTPAFHRLSIVTANRNPKFQEIHSLLGPIFAAQTTETTAYPPPTQSNQPGQVNEGRHVLWANWERDLSQARRVDEETALRQAQLFNEAWGVQTEENNRHPSSSLYPQLTDAANETAVDQRQNLREEVGSQETRFQQPRFPKPLPAIQYPQFDQPSTNPFARGNPTSPLPKPPPPPPPPQQVSGPTSRSTPIRQQQHNRPVQQQIKEDRALGQKVAAPALGRIHISHGEAAQTVRNQSDSHGR